MERLYTMRPINLAGEVTGYRAELVGVGSGADALRTIMQTAIQRVGVSITPVVCQQLLLEVFNAAVDFACDSGTSVNIADIISFKWNTRGKYDRIDASVPKSALSLTAIISPKITRNASPRFDLKLQSSEPTINSIVSPFDSTSRGVLARGYNLSNVTQFLIVDANNPDTHYVNYFGRDTVFEVTSDGRQIRALADGELLRNVPEDVTARLKVFVGNTPILLGPTFVLKAREWGQLVITSVTPQPFNVGTDALEMLTASDNGSVNSVDFVDETGAVKCYAVGGTRTTTHKFDVPAEDIEKEAAWAGGVLTMRAYDDDGAVIGTFLVNVAAYTM